MDITVKLQNPFSYALWPIILLGICILGIVAVLIILKLNLKFKRKPAVAKPVLQPVSTQDIHGLQMKYLKELDTVEQEFRKGSLSIRKAYQRMSSIVRRFVQERTGVKTHTYTLEDIRKSNMPRLEGIVGEFYSPEFSVKSEGDVFEALEKSRRMIEEWN